ncbi:MAG: hypothetical protein PHR87_13025, partial [Sulfurospirillaceae bacterium]|nr:hypothetical protein [Sulfurospirillaceae bacterium]
MIQNITDYCHNTPVLREMLQDAPLRIHEIGDGNLNFIFRAQTPQKSLIIKHAPPYLRMLGEAFILPQARICAEMHTMAHFASFASKLIPTIYHTDEQAFLFAMEDLRSYETLQQKQLAMPITANIYATLGDFSGLVYTHIPPSMPMGYYENS